MCINLCSSHCQHIVYTCTLANTFSSHYCISPGHYYCLQTGVPLITTMIKNQKIMMDDGEMMMDNAEITVQKGPTVTVAMESATVDDLKTTPVQVKISAGETEECGTKSARYFWIPVWE